MEVGGGEEGGEEMKDRLTRWMWRDRRRGSGAERRSGGELGARSTIWVLSSKKHGSGCERKRREKG